MKFIAEYTSSYTLKSIHNQVTSKGVLFPLHLSLFLRSFSNRRSFHLFFRRYMSQKQFSTIRDQYNSSSYMLKSINNQELSKDLFPYFVHHTSSSRSFSVIRLLFWSKIMVHMVLPIVTSIYLWPIHFINISGTIFHLSFRRYFSQKQFSTIRHQYTSSSYMLIHNQELSKDLLPYFVHHTSSSRSFSVISLLFWSKMMVHMDNNLYICDRCSSSIHLVQYWKFSIV